MLFGFTAKANHGLITFRILLWRIGQITQFFRQTVAEAIKLFHQWRTRFTRFRESVGSQENTRSAVTQHEISI
ncbi:Uncharacterised protein [Shigella sonnei]|nr:Uncharacterised protein [Shigella sonnei]